ncbi:MAG: hypothetical protein OEY54_06215 [Nitrosopumilus sp.]|nr:hypothetical protein [Nitrosopumilus sp.]
MHRVKNIPVFDESGCMQVDNGNQVMKHSSKMKLTKDDFIVVGMNYNYFMIPRLAYPKENLEKLKQQILDNQKMIAELETVWHKGEQEIIPDKVLQIMEKYFGKRTA